MRARKAKALRRMARAETLGQPERQLVAFNTNKTTAVNLASSTRGFYRAMKKLPWRFAGKKTLVDALPEKKKRVRA